MPIFKPSELTDAKTVTFSPNDLVDATPANSLADMTKTSTMTPAQAAKQHLAAKGITPEMVKLSPPTAQPTYPGDTSSWFDTGVVRPDPKHMATNLKSGGSFLGTAGTMVNPFAWLAGPVGEMVAPTNPTHMDSAGVNQSDPNSPQYNPTMLNLPDRLVNSIIPHPVDLAKEAYSRGEHGKTTSDMYAIPATMAATMAVPKIARAALPADIAAELARKTAGSALGTGPENFKHGATPDVAALKDLPGGLVTRSEGRLLSKVTNAKHAELAGLENDLNTPVHNNNFTDPMQSVTPVLDEAMSRAVPAEQPKIVEFRTLLSNKINSLSNGSMKLNPTQLVQLKRWLDGFIGTYKDEPVSTYKDLAQNTYSAVRQHLDSVAPEATVRGQKIQSLIEAEDALKNKITGNVPAPHTSLGELKNIAGTVFPSTLAKTGTAQLLKMFSGGAFDKPAPINLGGAPTQTPPIPSMAPPMATAQTPAGGSGGGSSKAVPNPATAPAGTFTPPPALDLPSPDLKLPNPILTKPLPPLPEPPNLTPAQEHAQLIAKRDAIIKEAALKDDTPNLTLKDEAARRKKANPTPAPVEVQKAAPPTETPTKPTHIKENTSVSGIDKEGNVVSGKLEKLYPVVEDGKATWKGTILDLRNSRTVDLPADNIFDRLTGPPEKAIEAKPRISKKVEAPAPLDKGAAAKKTVADWLEKKALRDMEEQLGVGEKKSRKK
jgi:hypothetical protein